MAVLWALTLSVVSAGRAGWDNPPYPSRDQAASTTSLIACAANATSSPLMP